MSSGGVETSSAPDSEADNSGCLVIGVQQTAGTVLNGYRLAGMTKQDVEDPAILGSGQLDEAITGHVPPPGTGPIGYRDPADGKLVDIAEGGSGASSSHDLPAVANIAPDAEDSARSTPR